MCCFSDFLCGYYDVLWLLGGLLKSHINYDIARGPSRCKTVGFFHLFYRPPGEKRKRDHFVQ